MVQTYFNVQLNNWGGGRGSDNHNNFKKRNKQTNSKTTDIRATVFAPLSKHQSVSMGTVVTARNHKTVWLVLQSVLENEKEERQRNLQIKANCHGLYSESQSIYLYMHS